MADYDPNTVSAYQQYGQSMMAGGGGRNMSGLGARQSTSSMTTVPDGPVDFTTIDTKTGTQKKVATIDYGSDNDDGPSYVNPTVIYHAAANASEDAGSVLTPTAPMINAANLYSMPNMAEQVYDYVYRADRNDAITSAIRSTQAEEQASVDAAVKSINKAITQGKTDAEIAEAFLNDMGGMGNDKPDPNGNFGVPSVTLKDVTGTDEGALSNPQPLYDFAEEMRNPSITVEELPPLTPDQKEKLGAKLREASDKGDLSSVMNQLAQDSKVQLSSAVTNFIEGAETQVASNNIDPITGLPFGDGDELGFTDVSPSAEAAEQQGLMARPAASDERQDPSYWDRVLFGGDETETPVEEPAVESVTEDTTEEDLVGDEPVVRDNIKVFGWKGRKGPTAKQKEAFNRLRDAAVAKGIVGDELRQLLAQAAVESAWYTAAVEGNGGSASNISGGSDYLGRGPLQLTHDYNYKEFGESKGVGDLYVDQPALLADPDLGTEASLWYWENYVQPKVSDFSDTFAVSGAINRGDPKKKALHLKDRKQAFQAIRLRDVGVRPMLRPTE